MPTIDGPHGALHYRDEGMGDPPVLLLHAFPLGGGMWGPQIEALAPRHRVVAPDLTGFGASHVPADRSVYSVDVWADDAGALVASLGLDRPVLVGLSMGGYAAFAFLRRHGDDLAGLVLADTRAGPDGDEARARREELQAALAEAGAPGPLADRLIGGLVGATSSRREDALAAARSLLERNRVEGMIGSLEALKNRPDSSGDLATIALPTLVVVGEQDQTSPPDEAKEMAGAIPGARLELVPDAGHLSNLENPSVFNRVLADFAGSLGPGPASP